MTALFVPALRIMGERFPYCAELSQHHSSAELGRKGVQAGAGLALPGRPVCRALPMQSMGPFQKEQQQNLQHCGLQSLCDNMFHCHS